MDGDPGDDNLQASVSLFVAAMAGGLAGLVPLKETGELVPSLKQAQRSEPLSVTAL